MAPVEDTNTSSLQEGYGIKEVCTQPLGKMSRYYPLWLLYIVGIMGVVIVGMWGECTLYRVDANWCTELMSNRWL